MTTTASQVDIAGTLWSPQPEAWAMVRRMVEDVLVRCPAAAGLAQRMREETGTRFVDWIDSFVLPRSDGVLGQLRAVGYEPDEGDVYRQPHGVFPRMVFHDEPVTQVLIKVESVADFVAAYPAGNQNAIDGMPGAAMRRARISATDHVELWVIERHGYRGVVVPADDPASAAAAAGHLDALRTRRRAFEDDAAGFDELHRLIDAAMRQLPGARVCDLCFQAEREYWMRRNHAAQAQYARQQRLGLGWANHDHHTYRSSRGNFTRLVAVWEKLGFVLRERFYAGAEAGWGAQVMEHPIAGIITFNDVDLSPDELLADFAHEPLPPRDTLGTVGLWCALHGDSALQAGMHHLECQFDFDLLTRQLQSQCGVQVMAPFTDFPYLRQAFTEGERWPVDPRRIDRLLDARLMTAEQAQQFRAHGAIGSHLENLERNDGFKGFNQKGVSDIISRTDPRSHLRHPQGLGA